MNLFDPRREVLNDTPCYANGFAINAWQVTCASNGGLIASIMLHAGNWQFKYYALELSLNELPSLFVSFRADPEKLLETLFGEDDMPPQLRSRPARGGVAAAKPLPPPNLDTLDLL